MKEISLLIKPASSACQLSCSYCFYQDVSNHRAYATYGIMSEEVMDTLIHKVCELVEEDGHITFAFQGGEPLLAGLSYFEQFVSYVRKVRKPYQVIHYAVQTNGILIDEDWCKFFIREQVLVGISLDGYASHHDGLRKDRKGKGTHASVLRAIRLLNEYQVPYNILTVLTRQLARHPQKLYRFYQEHNFTHIQLIPCLNDLDAKGTPFALTPELFASFYKTFFDLWVQEQREKKIIRSISLFDNLLLMLQDKLPYQCGMIGRCFMQLVVESDGSVYPCDFYVLDEYCCGNIMKDSLNDILHHKRVHDFLSQKSEGCDLCPDCPYYAICRGNCKRSADAYYRKDYCAYQEVLQHAVPYLQAMSQSINSWKSRNSVV